MARIGYHASHEQFSPRDLLKFVQEAEKAGFAAAMSSDHLAPWSHSQGESGHMWSWVGAALQATRFPVGFITVPCGWRYHPVIVAQAAATLAEMFPDRVPWIAVGSGEALNECSVAAEWPAKDQRNERLFAGVQIMRRLWRGERVSETWPIPVSDARLYTRANQAPAVIAGVLSAETAEWAGSWADGLITVNQPADHLKGIVDAFRRGGGAGKPTFLQVHVSYAPTEDEARAHAFDQWRANAVSADQAANLRAPEDFETATANVRPGEMDKHVRISADPEQHVAWLMEYAELGFEEIYVHNVGRNQLEFIRMYGSRVLGRQRG